MLDVGTEAPDFTLQDQNGQPVTLSSFRDVKNVLLVFFPLAFTGICQGELDEIRDHLPDYENDDTATLAISVGPPPTHKVWAIQSGFTFPVLSDFWPHGAVSQAYGVFNDDAGFANRGTFVVDRSGIIRFAEMKQPGERARSVGLDRRVEGVASRADGFPPAGRRRVACPARARSSVVELWFYTPAVVGSIPFAPTSRFPGQTGNTP